MPAKVWESGERDSVEHALLRKRRRKGEEGEKGDEEEEKRGGGGIEGGGVCRSVQNSSDTRLNSVRLSDASQTGEKPKTLLSLLFVFSFW